MVDVCGVVQHAEGDVAGPAGDVEDVPALVFGVGWAVCGGRAGVQGADEVVFPEAVDAQGHEVVHGVVGRGDGAEDGADWGGVSKVQLVIEGGLYGSGGGKCHTARLFLGFGHIGEAKVCHALMLGFDLVKGLAGAGEAAVGRSGLE